MFAVIETGGKQVRVEVGQVIEVERLAADGADAVVFDRVLLVGDDGEVRVGTPALEGARVTGSVVNQTRGRKVVIYTFKRRQNANRRQAGHRQHRTRVRIEAIEA